MNPTNSMIMGRFEALWSQRKDMESEWDEIEQFVAPLRGGKFFSDQSSQWETQWSRTEIYDSTAIDASDRLAKAMNSYLTNPSVKWFELNFRDTALNAVQVAKEWLQECGSRVYDELIESNFNGEMASAYLDLVQFGNAFVMEEVENELKYDGLSFLAMPIRECYFEPDHNDQIKWFYRHLQWTAVQIVDKFGAENCPTDIVEIATAGTQLDTKHSVIFCIYENDDYKEIDDDRPVVAPEDRRWGWKYLIREGDHEFSSGGYYEQPAYVSRWEKTSGNYWGFGPAHIALSTIKSVNEHRRLLKIRAAKEIDPNVFVEERNIVGDLDLEPGGLTVVKNIDGIREFFPTNSPVISSIDLADDQAMIRGIFFADDLVLKESPQMTATEVLERTERLIKLLGGTFGRLQTGLLNPVVERTFNILWRAGELPEMPQVVADSEIEDILDIVYTGALARSQKAEEVLNVRRWVTSIKEDAEFSPESLDIVDFDEMHRGEADLMGIPAKYIKAQKEVDDMRDERAAQKQAAEEAVVAEQQGKAMQAVGDGQTALRAVE